MAYLTPKIFYILSFNFAICTVTSITDMAALFITSTTTLPILRSFCLFAGMGVLFLYIFAITFFVGCLAIDEERRDAKKWINSDCVSSKPTNWKPKNHMEFGTYIFKGMVIQYENIHYHQTLLTRTKIICQLNPPGGLNLFLILGNNTDKSQTKNLSKIVF